MPAASQKPKFPLPLLIEAAQEVRDIITAAKKERAEAVKKAEEHAAKEATTLSHPVQPVSPVIFKPKTRPPGL